MTREENELLTRVGPGTACGRLMRRYWQPAALSEELSHGGPPQPVRLLAEDLVLFRDGEGRPGLLGLHCSHRGADLSYGRVEDGGLRCIYHGWLYDRSGRCLDQPGEPHGGEHKGSIRHLAYPCREQAGIIFAYMGPGEPPLLPNYEFLTVPENHRVVTKLFSDCNYLQGNEGNYDLIHLSFLHQSKPRNGRLSGRGTAPGVETLDAELTDFGVRVCKMREAESNQYLYVGTFILPSFFTFPGKVTGNGYSVNWHVPIDDTHHWKYRFSFYRERPLDDEMIRRGRVEGDITPDYKPVRNKTNRYKQDRSSMKEKSYSGIGFVFPAQDLCVTEGPGSIQDRTREHLVSSDLPLVVARKVQLKAIQDVQEGREAPYVVRDPRLNRFPYVFAFEGVAPGSTHWKEYLKQLDAEVKA